MKARSHYSTRLIDMPKAFIHTERTDARACPVCRRVLDAATGVTLEGGDPRPTMAIGDVTCCAYCGTVLTLTAIGLRLASDADLANLDPTLRTLLFEFADLRRRGDVQ
jgi:uncharacterized Zn-finger protein